MAVIGHIKLLNTKSDNMVFHFYTLIHRIWKIDAIQHFITKGKHDFKDITNEMIARTRRATEEHFFFKRTGCNMRGQFSQYLKSANICSEKWNGLDNKI